jgi:hypothetical protein
MNLRLREAFQAAGIQSTTALVGVGRPYIRRVGPSPATPAGYWVVACVGRGGDKAFDFTANRERPLALIKAKAWASERFDVPEDGWAWSPFGDNALVERTLLESRKAEIGYGSRR